MGDNITQILSSSSEFTSLLSNSNSSFIDVGTISNVGTLIEKIKVLFTDDVTLETLADAVSSLITTLKSLAGDVLSEAQPYIKTTLGLVVSGIRIAGIEMPERVVKFIKCLQNNLLDAQCPKVFLEASKPFVQRNVEATTLPTTTNSATDVLL